MESLPYIERFRQTQNELKGKKDLLLVSLDVGKKSSIACITDTSKEIYVKNFNVYNTKEGLDKMLAKAKIIKKEQNKKEIIFALEPTGNYHKPLASYLYSKDYMVCFVSSVAAKENRKTLHGGRWRKNDSDDAYNVADLLIQNKVLYYNPEDNLRYKELKELTRLRAKLSKRLSSIKVKVRNNIIATYFPELDSCYKEIIHPEVLIILKNFPTAEQIRNISFQEFYDKLTLTGYLTTQKKQRIYNVWHKAQNSIGCLYNKAVAIQTKFILEDINLLIKQIKEIDIQIKGICKDIEEYKYLQTIPGFGDVYSSIFISIVGNIKNFKYPHQLIKLAGLDLEYCESGNFRSKSRISKKGNSLLRYALSGAAKAAIRTESFKDWYEYQLKRKGNNKDTKRLIKTKLAVKLAHIAYAILTKQEKFDIIKIKQNSVIQPVLNVR